MNSELSEVEVCLKKALSLWKVSDLQVRRAWWLVLFCEYASQVLRGLLTGLGGSGISFMSFATQGVKARELVLL